jgi:hypothetical protein
VHGTPRDRSPPSPCGMCRPESTPCPGPARRRPARRPLQNAAIRMISASAAVDFRTLIPEDIVRASLNRRRPERRRRLIVPP